MKKRLFIILLTLVFIIIMPTYAASISQNTVDSLSFTDSVADILHVEKDDTKINLYFFYGEECSACKKFEKDLLELKERFPSSLNIYYYEVWHNKDNYSLLEECASQFGYTKSDGTPIALINNTMLVGYSPTYKETIEKILNEFIKKFPVPSAIPDDTQSNITTTNNTTYSLPILGKINAEDVSIPLVAIILGFIDGFNPCAMWILLLLISLFLGMQNRKRAWIFGFTFLFISALVYFLSMFGINIILDFLDYDWIKNIVSLFVVIAGFINLKKYFKLRTMQAGCTVVDDKKRKSIISKSKDIVNEKNIIFALAGIILLATMVNSLELFCSLGFPVIFVEILSINNIVGLSRILYILLYIVFYMIDDIFIFLISMITLKATGISNKYNKLCTLISAIIMIIIGFLLIFKPEWLMLNFLI